VVTVDATFVSYTVDGDRINGFRTITLDAGFEARSTPPTAYRFPTFSDPLGTRDLVRIASGPYADVYVSPEDPGVTYQPGD
jgi:hypothetical protein